MHENNQETYNINLTYFHIDKYFESSIEIWVTAFKNKYYTDPIKLCPYDTIFEYFCENCNVGIKCKHTDWVYNGLCLICGTTTNNPNTVTNLYDFIVHNNNQTIIPKPYTPKHKIKQMIKQLKTNINNDTNKEQSKDILQKLEYYINKI